MNIRKKLLLNLLVPVTVYAVTGLPAVASVVDEMLDQYQQQATVVPDPDVGVKLWNKVFNHAGTPQHRSCNSCHTRNLHNIGQHVKTKKTIEPMAPSANAERLKDRKKIEKWLKRNCKWTLGRECTVQEKADILAYIRSQ